MIGGRWKLHVLRALFVHDGQRYYALLRNIEGISDKELTRNLRDWNTPVSSCDRRKSASNAVCAPPKGAGPVTSAWTSASLSSFCLKPLRFTVCRSALRSCRSSVTAI
ncbi:winged helix-turn-helix transcriptional regulator [Mesorhizobium escarrei]|uniref:winged helix-turn-helix transcriptional regulator n=1 Tax=Mesorhizobium escarrei TaxID=666018 RepID=UPI00345B4D5E